MKPTGEQRDQFVTELLEKERSIAAERDKMKRATKVSRGRIDVLERRRDELMDLLEGREHVQPELPMAGRNGKKPAPPPLEWTKGAGSTNHVAHVAGVGSYCVELGTGGKYDVLFTPPGGRSRLIASSPIENEAKDMAKTHYLLEGADRILDNAGVGKLTKKGRRKIARQGADVS